MTIDEAIRGLQTRVEVGKYVNPNDEYRDIELGIDALKAIKCGREGLRTEFFTPLLGETDKL